MSRSRITALLATLCISAWAVWACGSEPSGSGEPVSGTGVVNSVVAAERKLNITHDPIPALGWPEMTMDFRLAEGASLEGIEAGDRVTFRLRQGANGVYEIGSLSPAGK